MTNLRFFRLEKKISQTELARRCGVSQPLLAQVELGDRRPYPKILRLAALALDVPFSALEPDLEKRGDHQISFNG